MSNIPFLDLKALNGRFKDDFLAATSRVLERGWFIQGEEVRLFEQEFADYCGTRHGIGVGNGLDAIALVLRSLLELQRLAPGDEVLVPGNTFIATALAVTGTGLALKLVEPETERFNLDPDAVERAIGPHTRAILAVHLYGRLADMERLREIARRHELLLIEDAAQAHGASLNGRKAGNWGVAAAFSLFPGKPLGALGDAGIITTDDDELAECLRSLRNYGSRVKYLHERVGVNSRLDELQAAFLRIKLRALDTDNSERDVIARRYCEEIRNPRLQLPSLPQSGETHAWHLFVIRCEQRDRLRDHLLANGIETLIHYPLPIHRQPAYETLSSLELPITEALSESVLSLPIYPGLSPNDCDSIIAACNAFSG
ncbi:DegT/DnrJ/EryC1/StrS aminotransferase family protein [Pseudomonas sp. ABC1]|uniref:DegT/DnrJ/EryC1/StrS family aminotransferase n=1 Tax=Pseudomonas sp. ABC1 TaxID=2748080 RepID=UPI001C4DF0D6|nr:DegT/DnrJ/EryC1/StrS family aminotransferase [Pseudomonas sp. ABC1]